MTLALPPGYVRQPWTAGQKTAARALAIARSGAKPGHRKLHGVQVPEKHWPLISFVANRFRYGENNNLRATRAFIRKLLRLLQ